MWPWEHLALGYLLYSGQRRIRGRARPTGGETALLTVGTQCPDLIDKPLAWTFDVLPSGISLAHSLVGTAGLCLLALAVARRRNRLRVGVAFTVGYLSHLLGDVLFYLLADGRLVVRFLLWPLVARPPIGETTFAAELFGLLGGFLAFLSTPRGGLYLVFELLLVGGAFLLWAADGRPGLRAVIGRLSGILDV